MQQFLPFKIVHVEGRNNECADALSRLHLHNLMEPKHDCLSDEEARLAEEESWSSLSIISIIIMRGATIFRSLDVI